jgi:DNA-binding NarL/FixJ family response regulator
MKRSPEIALSAHNGLRGSLNCDALSAREREVMLLAARGFANKEIARELNITEGTIKLHLHKIYQKLGIKSRFSLMLAEKLRLGTSEVRWAGRS